MQDIDVETVAPASGARATGDVDIKRFEAELDAVMKELDKEQQLTADAEKRLELMKRVQDIKVNIEAIQKQCASVKKKRKALEAELATFEQQHKHSAAATKLPKNSKPTTERKTEATKTTYSVPKFNVVPKPKKPKLEVAKEKKAESSASEEEEEEESKMSLKEQALQWLKESELSTHAFCERVCWDMAQNGHAIATASMRRWLDLHDGSGVSPELAKKIETAIEPLLLEEAKR